MFELLNMHFGYLDPGTGSLIIQSIVGVVAGVTVFGRNAIARLSDKTRRLFSKPATTNSASADETE